MTNTPTRANRTVAKAAAAAFGGAATVQRYWDDDHHSSIALLSCQDSPVAGVTSYATIGVSDVPLVMKDGKTLGVRAELVGACRSQDGRFGNALSTAAFCVINSGWFVAPGVVFPDVLAMYSEQTTMKHILFLPPLLWGNEPETLALEEKQVAWLMAVPISEAEYRYIENESVVALEGLLEKGQIDMFDLNRRSVV